MILHWTGKQRVPKDFLNKQHFIVDFLENHVLEIISKPKGRLKAFLQLLCALIPAQMDNILTLYQTIIVFGPVLSVELVNTRRQINSMDQSFKIDDSIREAISMVRRL